MRMSLASEPLDQRVTSRQSAFTQKEIEVLAAYSTPQAWPI